MSSIFSYNNKNYENYNCARHIFRNIFTDKIQNPKILSNFRTEEFKGRTKPTIILRFCCIFRNVLNGLSRGISRLELISSVSHHPTKFERYVDCTHS